MPKSEQFGDASIISRSKKEKNTEYDSNRFISEEDAIENENLWGKSPIKFISSTETPGSKEMKDIIEVVSPLNPNFLIEQERSDRMEVPGFKKEFLTNTIGNYLMEGLINELNQGFLYYFILSFTVF